MSQLNFIIIQIFIDNCLNKELSDDYFIIDNIPSKEFFYI